MGDRRLPGLLALAGAIVLGLGCWLPYESQDGIDYQVFQHGGGYAGQLYYAVEPAAVMILAAVIGIMLLRSGLSAVWPAALITTGCQTCLLWVGYIGGVATPSYGGHLKAGAWVGLVGSLMIAAAGVIALRMPGESAAPPGWYEDPTAGGQLRYWSGSAWTDHTAERPAAG